MAVRVEKSGWVVEGNTLEELEIGIEAVQRVLGKASAPQKTTGRTADGPSANDDRTNPLKLRSAITFLETIQSHADSGGASGEDLIQSMGIDGPKGLGGASGSVNRTISEVLHCDIDEVYTRTEKSPEGRRWLPGPAIADSIHELKLRLRKL